MTDQELIIYVHGVGMCPLLFDEVVAQVPGRYRLWTRPGYRTVPGSSRFEDQVQALNTFIEQQGPALVVGVSGGATLALASAISNPPGLVGIVTHEPLVGPLEPELHARVSAGARRLRRAPSSGAARSFLVGLYSSRSWDRLTPPAQQWVTKHLDVVCREVAEFASFAPAESDLASIVVPHATTVGSLSGPERHRVGELLGRHGASVTVLNDCGNLAVVDSPTEFADVVRQTRRDR